jgi:hypothetical protein
MHSSHYACFMQIFRDTLNVVAGVAQTVSRFDPRQGQRIPPPASVSRPALGPTQPPIHGVPGGGGPFPGGKARPGRDADHSPHIVPRS